MPDNDFEVTVLVDGEPRSETYPKHEKVEEVIKSLLPASQRGSWSDYQLSDRNSALDPSISLEAAGVQDGDVLSFTKKEGGGGAT